MMMVCNLIAHLPTPMKSAAVAGLIITSVLLLYSPHSLSITIRAKHHYDLSAKVRSYTSSISIDQKKLDKLEKDITKKRSPNHQR